VTTWTVRKGPLRVEQALRLLPELASVEPLRALLVASSRREREDWISKPCSTVGKHLLDPYELRGHLPSAVGRLAEHLGALYEAAFDALEAEQQGDLAETVRALLRAGELEEDQGRSAQARQWYLRALAIAEELRDRRPEIRALQRVGSVELAHGHLERAARSFQRSLALAEAELDAEGAANACRALGDVARARSQWWGAESWFARGLGHAGGDRWIAARLTCALGETALARGEEELAAERLLRARQDFESAGDREGLIRSLLGEARLAARRGRTDDALAGLASALDRVGEAPRAAPLEIEIHILRGELLLMAGRVPGAEDELRRGEDLAIAFHLPHLLARLYVVLGKARALRSDEDGFVFFEKALDLCGGSEPAPHLAAQVWREYAEFRSSLGQLDEARTCAERSRALLERLGDATPEQTGEPRAPDDQPLRPGGSAS
jgi:tetratricopeptide (TPR) repeat protein